MRGKKILFGTIIVAFIMLMVPNISALTEPTIEEKVNKNTEAKVDEIIPKDQKVQSIINFVKEKLNDGNYDWPLLCLAILGIGVGAAAVVFVLSLALGRIGTAITNAIAALVTVLQLAAAILGGLGVFAGAVGTLLVWIDYLNGVKASL